MSAPFSYVVECKNCRGSWGANSSISSCPHCTDYRQLLVITPWDEYFAAKGLPPETKAEDKDALIASLRAEIANLTLLSDSQLANQERLVGEMRVLRQQLVNSGIRPKGSPYAS